MSRSRHSNNYLIDTTAENCVLYTQQRNKCVALLRKAKRNYYENLDEKAMRDIKKIGRL